MKDTLSIEQIKERLICQTEQDKLLINTKQDAQIAIEKERCARWYVKSAPCKSLQTIFFELLLFH